MSLLFLTLLIPSSIPNFLRPRSQSFFRSAPSRLTGGPSPNTKNHVGGSLNIIAENNCGLQTTENNLVELRAAAEESRRESEVIVILLISVTVRFNHRVVNGGWREVIVRCDRRSCSAARDFQSWV
ncbi:hypothetical protein ACSQ67_021733 [Phaseolus vulgaris]